MAAPKALKSYNGTGLFAIFIHPMLIPKDAEKPKNQRNKKGCGDYNE